MRQVTCHHCKQKGDKEIMLKEGKKYIHKECREFLNKENQEWDELYQYLLKLHDIVRLPIPNIVRLQALRNGNDIKQGKEYKKYKMGVPYSLMLEAYKLAEDKIKMIIKTKLNGQNDAKAINYCISIMLSMLNEAWKNRKKAQQDESKRKKTMEQINEISSVMKRIKEVQVNNQKEIKNEAEVDITTLLD